MAYTPTNWQAGDVISSAKLNKMEQGIAAGGTGGGGAHIVTTTVTQSGTSMMIELDETWQQIYDVVGTTPVFVSLINDDYEYKELLPITTINGDGHEVHTIGTNMNTSGELVFNADSADAKPAVTLVE